MGKILLTGSFFPDSSGVSQQICRLARLNTDGSLRYRFQPGTGAE